MSDERHPSAAEETKRLYEEAESRTARAFETLVSRDSFGELLARVTENVVALTKLSTDAFDLFLRNLRLAGRQDIIRLSRQLGRAEDKLEMLLQEIEQLRDEQRDQLSGSRGARPSDSASGRDGTESPPEQARGRSESS
jgi:hypothetical protein